MISELRPKSQITIPKNIINSLKLSTGDKLDIYEKDGMICIVPVVVYPKQYVDDLELEIKILKENIKRNKQEIYDDVETLISSLEEKT